MVVSGLAMSGSEARDMLSGDAEVGGVELKDAGFDEASVASVVVAEKLTSGVREARPAIVASVASMVVVAKQKR